MGLVFSGIPQEITLKLAKLANVTTFVETGTYKGETTRWAAQHFQKVFTIEKSDFHFEESKSLGQLPGVRPLFGDSSLVLPELIAELGNEPALFFLDGHWSGGQTAGADDECPLMNELWSLKGRGSDIILIDDARLFHAPPPLPHNAAQWPTIGEVVLALQSCLDSPYISIVDDVIFAIPNCPILTVCMIEYARERSSVFWNTFRNGESLKHHLIGGLPSAKKLLSKRFAR
jgi:hypothetical protein